MKFCKWLVLLVLIGSASPVAVSAAASSDADKAAPGDLVFEPDSDLAVEGFLGSMAEIGYTVRNTGTHAITIKSANPRRGGGRGSFDLKPLKPGASSRLILHREFTELGVRQYPFRVRTDDPRHRDYRLVAGLFGMSAYSPDIPAVVFDVVRAGQITAKRITVSSYETSRLDLKAILESPPWLEIHGVPREAGDMALQDLTLEVRIKKDAPRGLLQGNVHLLTTATVQPDLIIPVRARVFDDVSVTPYPVTFAPSHKGDVRKLELEFRALDGRALKLADIADSRSLLSFTSLPCGADCLKVETTLKAPGPARIDGVIRARFHNRSEPLLVPWNAIVVSATTELRDLGVIGDEGVDVDHDATGVPMGGRK